MVGSVFCWFTLALSILLSFSIPASRGRFLFLSIGDPLGAAFSVGGELDGGHQLILHMVGVLFRPLALNESGLRMDSGPVGEKCGDTSHDRGREARKRRDQHQIAHDFFSASVVDLVSVCMVRACIPAGTSSPPTSRMRATSSKVHIEWVKFHSTSYR